MKKTTIIIASVIAASIFSSCTKSDPISIETPETPIAFQTMEYASQTKAGENEEFKNDDFGVFGYQHTLGWTAANAKGSTGTPSVLMNDIKVEKKTNVAAYAAINNGGTVWAPSQVYYWPKKDYLTFAAYSPYGMGNASFSYENGIKFGSFEVDPDPSADNNIDLLYSDTSSDNTIEGNTSIVQSGVYLLFHHALAKIGFNCKFDNTKLNPGTTAVVNVNSIKIIGIDTKGQNFTAKDHSWNTSEALEEAQSLGVTPANLSTGGAAFVENYFVMPQSLEKNAQKILVSYTITTTFADETTKTETITDKEVILNGTTIKAWAPNTQYVYTLGISAVSGDPITFQPEVAPWENGNEDE